MTSATRTNGPNAALDAAYRFGYGFDEVGNRLHEDRGQMQLNGSYNANDTNDSQRVYTWDEENRLIAIETAPAAAAIGVAKKRSEYLYDAQWRRILKTDYAVWTGEAFAETNTTRYVWDGWNLLAEVLSPASGVLSTNTYTWGFDLSQSLQGAGGIGGLLAIATPLPLGEGQGEGSMALPCYDGNGNICDYLNTNGTVVAHREYDPFGRTVSATGDLQAEFKYWFSTKPEEPQWGLYYYGYRYYSPGLGRWLSRDPIRDASFFDRYVRLSAKRKSHVNAQGVFVINVLLSNDPISAIDLLGLSLLQNDDEDDDMTSDELRQRLKLCTRRMVGDVEKSVFDCALECVLSGDAVGYARCLAGCISQAGALQVACCMLNPPDADGKYRRCDDMCAHQHCVCLANTALKWSPTLPADEYACEIRHADCVCNCKDATGQGRFGNL